MAMDADRNREEYALGKVSPVEGTTWSATAMWQSLQSHYCRLQWIVRPLNSQAVANKLRPTGEVSECGRFAGPGIPEPSIYRHAA